MKIGWVIIGILITVGLFLFFPNLFYTLVSWVQSLFHFILSFVQSHNTTNITGA